MKKQSIVGGWVLAGILCGFMLVACAGCCDGLQKVMSEYHFTAISPPQSNWENGSVVEIDPRYPNAPTLHSMPSMVPVSILNIDHQAPDVSQNYSEKLDLSLGLSLPDEIKAQLTAQGVSQYSVVATGNILRSVPLDSYVSETFPKIAEKFGGDWTIPLAEGRLYYFYEVWLCDKLTYKFYDSKGANATITVPIKIPVDLTAGWTANEDGSLVFAGPESICLGYMARPVQVATTGKTEPEATKGGKATAAGRQAGVKFDKPQEGTPPK